MKFLNKIADELLAQNSDLSEFQIVLPGKRPAVFFRKILAEKKYSGILPNFVTIEDLITQISGLRKVQGVFLWLFAFRVYEKSAVLPKDSFNDFLKWFPTILKDWDDMLKFASSDTEVLQYLLDEERIRDWAQNLGELPDEAPRKKFLNFWRNMNVFLPQLKAELKAQNFATPGMVHEAVKIKLQNFVQIADDRFVFAGFNALTPVEEELIRELLQHDKAQVFFMSDRYYMEDSRQEAGKFLREYKTWKEFNSARSFNWIEDDFSQAKQIEVLEMSGNVSETKMLPKILEEIQSEDSKLNETAVVLLDENLLPATMEALSSVGALNITMGFPLKNLNFSNAVRHLFHLQKQLEKNQNSYYHSDLLAILEEFPGTVHDSNLISAFRNLMESRNIIYVSSKLLKEQLSELSYFSLLVQPERVNDFLSDLIAYCIAIRQQNLDDVQAENVFHFEKIFRILNNQLKNFERNLEMDSLEVLVNQLINSETIDFEGEPLSGLQLTGLLETRLLNFKNVIMLSVNEGKLPLGNTQNTYIPFEVRNHFNLHTFLENDSIYAYHFYRLIQNSEKVYLLYNALSSGVNTGERSRFITQLTHESKQNVPKNFVVESPSDMILKEPITIQKTDAVVHQLSKWKDRVSPTHLTTYLYNPVDFYLGKVLATKQAAEIEDELSIRNYGNLVHYALQFIYEQKIGKVLSVSDLYLSDQKLLEAVEFAIGKLKHQPEYYKTGINFIHRSIAEKVIRGIVNYDRKMVEDGHSLKILGLELNFEQIPFAVSEADTVHFYGFIDRIDELDGIVRIIDYKTAKTKNLSINLTEDRVEDFLINNDRKQALQLSIYNYVVERLPDFADKPVESGIWSFAELSKGVVPLTFSSGNNTDAMISVKNLILEILNPEIPFTERIIPEFNK